MVMRARSVSIAHPGHIKFEQAISNQSLCQCLSAVKYPLFHLGSQIVKLGLGLAAQGLHRNRELSFPVDGLFPRLGFAEVILNQ